MAGQSRVSRAFILLVFTKVLFGVRRNYLTPNLRAEAVHFQNQTWMTVPSFALTTPKRSLVGFAFLRSASVSVPWFTLTTPITLVQCQY